MTDHAPGRFWSGIDIPKTIAGVLAAVSAAVLGSFLGVAGTLAGAAVASVIGSVGTEIYHRWIDRGSKKIKSTFVTVPAAVGTPPVAAAEEETPSEPDPPAAPTKLRWGRVAAFAAAVFVLAMGSLTAYELIAQRTIADAVGNSSTRTTTVASVLDGGSGSTEEETPATTPSESAPATDEARPTETPETSEPTSSGPATSAPAETAGPAETADPAPTTGPPAGETGAPATGQEFGGPTDDGSE